MTNKFYVPGQDRSARVKDLFAAIAPRYDLINDLQSFGMHRHWKRRLLKLAAGQPGQRALDLCCGTGDIALAMARQGLDVTGVDFSEPMLAVAEKRSKVQSPKSKVPLSVRFARGDAQQLSFADDSFDIVTIGYGLRNLSDFEQGLREIRRVLRPGGKLLILDFGKPDNALWRGMYFTYLRCCVPLLGRIFCGDADTHGYILESLLHYPAQRGVDAKLRELNFTETRIVNLLGGVMSINYAQKPPAVF